MHRRRVLSLVSATAVPGVAGCTTGTDSDDTDEGLLADRGSPPVDKLLSETRPSAERPRDANEETVDPIWYPGKPASYSSRSVRSFVETFERAYRRNEVLGKYGGGLVAHRFDFDWTAALDASETAGVGRCQYSYTTAERSDSADDDASRIVGDSPTYVVTYYVDDSVVVRAEDSGKVDRRDELTPDPWESGVVLEDAE